MGGSFRFGAALVLRSWTVPLLWALGASQAGAAPQILAMIANAEPVTLQCERGECGAEFTVYCIEQRRAPPVGAPGRALAQEGFEHCSAATLGGMMSLRQCLGSQHDTFIGKLNTKYWRAIEVGS